jgi:hypothetical protein
MSPTKRMFTGEFYIVGVCYGSGMPSLLRSMIAVIVGYMVMMLVVIALTLVMVKTMGLQSGHPTPAYLAANLVYSLAASALGGLTTGSIAAERRVRHGYILVMGALSYTHYKGGQPAWYQGTMVVVPPMLAVLGAKVAELRATRR